VRVIRAHCAANRKGCAAQSEVDALANQPVWIYGSV